MHLDSSQCEVFPFEGVQWRKHRSERSADHGAFSCNGQLMQLVV